jgi:hypothetical protein
VNVGPGLFVEIEAAVVVYAPPARSSNQSQNCS